MIAVAVLLAAVALSPAAVLDRYAAALTALESPRVLSFEYALDQTGGRVLEQTHRIFRRGGDERDEILTVDGKHLSPPSIHIFRGRPNRYTMAALAPRPAAYDFRYVGPRRNGRHVDYVFTTTPKAAAAYVVTSVTIDGVAFVPTTIAFTTTPHRGSGTVTFAQIEGHWVPTLATARSFDAGLASSERIAFTHYRFPASLPAATFEVPRPLPARKPPAS